MVNAEKEGQIESKLMRARQLEEIREAKRKEAEARAEQKKSKLVCSLGAVSRKSLYADTATGRDQGRTARNEKEEEEATAAVTDRSGADH